MKPIDKNPALNLQAESMLEGPFWPERIKVISSKEIGANVEVRGVGLETERFYSRILAPGRSYQN
jgi:hypothetical protein